MLEMSIVEKPLEKVDVKSDYVQISVKDDLELIVLAMMLKQPMCGTEIIKTIHNKFGVLLSPGTIYPLLHSLEKKGLLRCKRSAKIKTYEPVEGSKKKISEMLEERVKAWGILSQFLRER